MAEEYDAKGLTIGPQSEDVSQVGNYSNGNNKSINVYTGQLEESFTIGSLVGTGNIGISLTLDYNSSGAYLAKKINSYSQASPFGFGFDLGSYSIICDHKNTRNIEDDVFTIVASDTELELIPIPDTVNSYITEDGNSWIITRFVDTVNSYEEIIGWTVKTEDGLVYRYGDFCADFDSLNATRNLLSYGSFVGEGITQDDYYFPCQWDLSMVHDPDSTNWIEITYLNDRKYLKVLDANDSIVNSNYSYTQFSYIENILASDSTKLKLYYSDRLDTLQSVENYSYYFGALQKADSIQFINRYNEPLSCSKFSYIYVSKDEFKKLFLRQIVSHTYSSLESYPAIYFNYDIDSLSEYYGRLVSIQYPSGMIKEISYAKVADNQIRSQLEYIINDSINSSGGFDEDKYNTIHALDNIFIARGTTTKVGIWDGGWQIDSFTVDTKPWDRAAVSEDGWAAIYDHDCHRIIVKRWDDGHWTTDSLSGIVLNDHVSIRAHKDYFIATTTDYDKSFTIGARGWQLFSRCYLYTWNGDNWTGQKILGVPDYQDDYCYDRTTFALFDNWIYFNSTNYRSNGYPLESIVHMCRLDKTNDQIYIDSVVIDDYTSYNKGAYGPGFFGFLGVNGLNLYRYNNNSWEYTSYHDNSVYFARAIAPLKNGIAWAYDNGPGANPPFNYSILEAVVLTSDGWKGKWYRWLNSELEIKRIFTSDHSIVAQYSTENIELFEIPSNNNNLEYSHYLWNSGTGIGPWVPIYLFTDYHFLESANAAKRYNGNGIWDSYNKTIRGSVSPSIEGNLLHSFLIENDHPIHGVSGTRDSVSLTNYNGYYGLFNAEWVNGYNTFGVRYSDFDPINSQYDSCFGSEEVKCFGNTLYNIEKIEGCDLDTFVNLDDDTTITYDCPDSWVNTYANRIIDTLFTGKPNIYVVNQVKTYKYLNDTLPICYDYNYYDGRVDKTDNMPKFSKVVSSLPYYLNDEPDGYSVTYFYNDVGDTAFSDNHLSNEFYIPNLDSMVINHPDTNFIYGIRNGGYYLDGLPIVTYSYSSDSGVSETNNCSYNYYSLNETRYSSIITGVYHKLLDSIITYQEGVRRKVSYEYDPYNLQASKIIREHIPDSSRFEQLTRYAINDRDAQGSLTQQAIQRRQDNAIIAISSDSSIYISGSDTTILDIKSNKYVKRGNWMLYEASTYWDYSDFSSEYSFENYDTNYIDLYGNCMLSYSSTGDTSWIKLDEYNDNIIAVGTASSPNECIIMDFEQSNGWDGCEYGVNGSNKVMDENAYSGDSCLKITNSLAFPLTATYNSINSSDLTDSLYLINFWYKTNYKVGIVISLFEGANSYTNIIEVSDDHNGVLCDWTNGQLVINYDSLTSGIVTDSVLVTLYIPPYTATNNTVYVDNFRFHPLNARVESSVFDKSSGQLTADFDYNNLPNFIEYDSNYRIHRLRNFNNEIVSEREYGTRKSINYTNFDLEIEDPTTYELETRTINKKQNIGYELFIETNEYVTTPSRACIYRNNSLIDSIVCGINDELRKTGSFTAYPEDVIKIETQKDGESKLPEKTWHIEIHTWIETESYDPNDPTYVKTIEKIPGGNSISNYSFFDNYGSKIQTRSTNFIIEPNVVLSQIDTVEAALVSSCVERDARGRVIKAYKPYYDLVNSTGPEHYTPFDSIIVEANSYYDGSNDSDCDGRPYVEYDFDNDIRGKLLEISKPGVESTWGIGEHTSRFEYHRGDHYSSVIRYDEDGNQFYSGNENWGRTSIDTVFYTNSNNDPLFIGSTTFKNIKGNIDSVKVSNGTDSVYTQKFQFNDMDLTTSSFYSDYGYTRVIFDYDGNTRFSQNEKNLVNEEFVYYKYDEFGRQIEEGLCDLIYNGDSLFVQDSAFVSTFPDENLSSIKSVKYRWCYDYNSSISNVVHYDKLIRVENSDSTYYKEFYYFPFENKDSAWVKLPIDSSEHKSFVHEYDDITNEIVSSRVYLFEDTSGARGYNYYYDLSGRFESVREAEVSEVLDYIRDYCKYSYNADGSKKQMQLGVYDSLYLDSVISQTVDYSYNAHGLLSKINDLSNVVDSLYGTDDHFAMQLYYDDQQVGAGEDKYHNGVVGRIDSRNSADGTVVNTIHDYNYNEIGWLTSVDYGADGSINTNGDRQYNYNFLGRRESIQVNQYMLSYKYLCDTSSILLSENDNLPVLMEREYDLIGNLEADPVNSIDFMGYDYRHLLDTVSINPMLFGLDNHAIVNSYDEFSQRIAKKYNFSYLQDCCDTCSDTVGGGGIELMSMGPLGPGGDQCQFWSSSEKYYLYDGNMLLAIFSGQDNVEYTYINSPQEGAIGVYHLNIDSCRYYFVKDQIKNTRVIVDDEGDVVNYTNYHPFGQVSNSWTVYEDPHMFSSKEYDKYSGFEYYYFGTRYYDPGIGNFISIDKAAQYVNGYSYCGNNPVSGVDQDGNLAWWAVAIIWTTVDYGLEWYATGEPPSAMYALTSFVSNAAGGGLVKAAGKLYKFARSPLGKAAIQTGVDLVGKAALDYVDDGEMNDGMNSYVLTGAMSFSTNLAKYEYDEVQLGKSKKTAHEGLSKEKKEVLDRPQKEVTNKKSLQKAKNKLDKETDKITNKKEAVSDAAASTAKNAQNAVANAVGFSPENVAGTPPKKTSSYKNETRLEYDIDGMVPETQYYKDLPIVAEPPKAKTFKVTESTFRYYEINVPRITDIASPQRYALYKLRGKKVWIGNQVWIHGPFSINGYSATIIGEASQ
ncbi:MAG: RHS repeat-associated core domain-containing protein [Bacteroidetes bacterium]|nr:RHS repeat-associated core domain-containing protein [Bacteroidota bacterium]